MAEGGAKGGFQMATQGAAAQDALAGEAYRDWAAGVIERAFPSITRDDAEAVAAITAPRAFRAGEVLAGPAAPPSGVTIITEGAVRIEQDGEVVRVFEPFAYFGEGALIRDDPPAVTLIADRPTAVVVLPKERFKAFLRDHPGFGLSFTTMLLRECMERLKATTVLFAKNKQLADRLKKTHHELEEEIRARKDSEEKALYLANHDVLTGLANRAIFSAQIDNAISRSERDAVAFAVILIDVDGFKEVNDTQGHLFGDEVLRVIARRIQNCARAGDVVARLGGDEFVILQNFDPRQDADARFAALSSLGERLVTAMAEEIRHDGVAVQVGASIGIAMFPSDGDSQETLMRNVDLAMYQAKNEGKSQYKFFTNTIEERVVRITETKAELRKALENDQFEIHFQPKIAIDDLSITGMEALLRWSHPEKGYISPADFIPVAENSRFIVPIGRWILTEACRLTAQWRAQGLSMFRVAINLSPVQFRHDDVIAAVDEALAGSGLPPEALEIEITEGVLLHQEEAVISALNGLRERGVSIAVDDFGTGYSSMSYLKKLRATAVKIDRAFVQNCHEDLDDQMICQAVIGLAHSLGMSVVAEGVSHIEQIGLLKKFRCDHAQGYLIAPPLDVTDFEDFVHAKLIREVRAVVDLGGAA